MERNQERKVVTLMIELYYKHHKAEIEEKDPLIEYVNFRLDHCPFGDKKGFCSNCKIHCYKPEYRAMIKKVMRYSGPMMLFYHPLIAIRHLHDSLKEKKLQKKAEKKKAKEALKENKEKNNDK